MFGKKNMVEAAIKPRKLTSTAKTLQDQLFKRTGNWSIQGEADLQRLDVNKALTAEFSLIPSTVLSKVQQLKLTSFFHG